MANLPEKITTDVLEATEFPSLAAKYRVQGVPKSIINEKVYIDGGVPNRCLCRRLKKSLIETRES